MSLLQVRAKDGNVFFFFWVEKMVTLERLKCKFSKGYGDGVMVMLLELCREFNTRKMKKSN